MPQILAGRRWIRETRGGIESFLTPLNCDNLLLALCKLGTAPKEAAGLVIPLKLCTHEQPTLAGSPGLLGSRMNLLGHGQETRLLWCPVAGGDGTSEPKVGGLATVWCQRASE